MLAPVYFSNYTHLAVLAYFSSYCITLLGFCAFFAPYLSATPNIYQLVAYLSYNKKKFKLFALVFLSFLGVPPVLAFGPKFACLAQVWVYSGWTLFFFALTASFLSFALYIQVFDMLFAKRKHLQVLQKSNPKRLNLKAFRAYPTNLYFSAIAFFVLGGIFFYKDFILVLGIFC